MGRDKFQKHCTCNPKPDKHYKFDIRKTTTCPYCGIRFASSREVLIHIFKFHSG